MGMFVNHRIVTRLPRLSVRTIYSLTGVFEPHLEADTLHNIEKFWKPRLSESLPTPPPTAPKYYVLSMFPYPSGQLHMGHVRVYSISDTFAHYYRMKGYNVIHPMGWDAFGLPAENAAIEHGVRPEQWTKENIGRMRHQLEELGCSFDWWREVTTCSPSYYRWTQHLFLLLHQAGLVYQAESMVNWDPVDQTVLADEQVDGEGRSWRSGAKVEKKALKQWFFRTTSFSSSLWKGLEDPSLFNWRDIVAAQRNWIGKCSGTKLDFPLLVAGQTPDQSKSLTVWTDQPELVYGAEFIVLHPDHIVPSLYSGQSDQLSAVNPFTGRTVPVLVTSEAKFEYGSQTILGFPGTVEAHRTLANSLGVPTNIGPLTDVSREGDIRLTSSAGPLTGLSLKEARNAVMSRARQEGWGGHETSSNLQDWLISRQRYWGTPIPMVHCPDCGAVPVPASQLPVSLPDVEGDQGEGRGGPSPLLQNREWLETTCPSCGGKAVRETDTMDTFVDSSWYFLRYLDPHNDKEPFSEEAVQQMPVDLYIGGKEHAYLHLFFARFFSHFLHSIGMIPVKEPFSSLITQGMVKGRSYRVKKTTRYLAPHQVTQVEGTDKFVETETGDLVVTNWEKMSKSKHNGVDPGSMVEQYGCDTVRLMMLSNVGPGSERNWSEDSYPGIRNMSIRLWKLVYQAVDLQDRVLPELRYDEELNEYRDKLREARNLHLKHVNYNYSFTRNLAVVIARLHSMINSAWSVPGQVKQASPEYQQMVGDILLILAPIAPHLATELWECFRTVPNRMIDKFDFDANVWHQSWPELEPTTNLDLKVVANKKEVARLPVVKWYFDSLTEEQAFDLACHDNNVQDKVLPYEIVNKTFEKREDFEAVLEIEFTRKDQKKPKLDDDEFLKIKAAKKEAKRLEKLEKKQQREERVKAYQENIARRDKVMKTIPKYPQKDK